MARPVADFAGAITQLLLPSKVSVAGSADWIGNRSFECVRGQPDLLGCEREDLQKILGQARVDARRHLRVPGRLQANADLIRWQVGGTDYPGSGHFTVEISG